MTARPPSRRLGRRVAMAPATFLRLLAAWLGGLALLLTVILMCRLLA